MLKRCGRYPGIAEITRGRHERQGLHPRVHRHHRAQPRELHAPHDRQLEPDRSGGARPALLRRVGHGRLDAVGGPRWSTCGRRRASTGSPSGSPRDRRAPSLQDQKLEQWWAEAAGFRRGGIDRILVPAPWTRTIGELAPTASAGGVRARAGDGEAPARRAASSTLVRGHGASTRIGDHGLELVGAWRTAMRDDAECIVMWAIPTWEPGPPTRRRSPQANWMPGSNVAEPARSATSGS